MAEKKQKLPLEEELSYWKGHISVRDVLASELSYSLIYNNVRPDRLAHALGTVGLTVLPNRFLLIQVDDYQNRAVKLQLTQEYFQKTTLVHLLQDCLQATGVQGFAANMIGLDNLICFVCFPEEEKSSPREFLEGLVESFQQSVRKKSPYTISVCVSRRCTRLQHYSQLYAGMNLALSRNYFAGKEFRLFMDEELKKSLPDSRGMIPSRYYPELLTAIARGNAPQFEQALKSKLRELLTLQTGQQSVRFELVRLLQRLEEYCVRCGVPEQRIRPHTETAAGQVMACGFLADTVEPFLAFFAQATRALAACRSEAYTFRLPVEAYICEYYANAIRLGDLAGLMGFSEGHFARTFRREFGCSFVQYLTEYRIRQSKKLLAETHIPIEQLAGMVGISSYSYFCTCFKQVCGISPGRFRRQEMEKARREQENKKRSGAEPYAEKAVPAADG